MTSDRLRSAAWLVANGVASWLLVPVLLQPFHVPPVAAYLFVGSMSWVSLFIWPFTTIALLLTKAPEIIHGRALNDMLFSVLPGLIEFQLVRLGARGLRGPTWSPCIRPSRSGGAPSGTRC